MLTLNQVPNLHEPTLVVALDGWIDAGYASPMAVNTLIDGTDAEPIGEFDTDILLDYRARRPSIVIDEGLITEIRWADLKLMAAPSGAGVGGDVLFLVGAEPDRCWRAFVEQVVDLVDMLGISRVIGLASYPAPVPHTRPTRLALTTTSPRLADSMTGYVRGSLEVPGGLFAAIDDSVNKAGVDAFCLWAQVPHYAANLPYPAGALALIEGLNAATGLSFRSGSLGMDAMTDRSRLDNLVSANPEHSALVSQLEQFVDSDAAGTGPEPELGSLPSGDDIAEELQRFLRSTDGDDD